MKTLTLTVATLSLALLISPALFGQLGKKVTGGGIDSGNGFDSGSVGVETTDPDKTPPAVIREIAVTEERTWKNRDGKMIVASLLAHRTADDKEVPKDTPPTIVKEGRVRLLMNGKPFLLELASLSIEDQVYIEKLQETIARHHAQPVTSE